MAAAGFEVTSPCRLAGCAMADPPSPLRRRLRFKQQDAAYPKEKKNGKAKVSLEKRRQYELNRKNKRRSRGDAMKLQEAERKLKITEARSGRGPSSAVMQ